MRPASGAGGSEHVCTGQECHASLKAVARAPKVKPPPAGLYGPPSGTMESIRWVHSIRRAMGSALAEALGPGSPVLR